MQKSDKNINVSQQPLENLDCTGAGICQPTPADDTDTHTEREYVQKAMDKKRCEERKKK